MTRLDVPIVVIGAGVSGLTTAIGLAEAGYSVTVHAAAAPAETTSCAAGAMWGPHLVNHPGVADWAATSLKVFKQLADDKIGIRLVTGVEASREITKVPDWMREADGFRECGRNELPAGYAIGWEYTVPIIDMPVYLAYLTERAHKNDVQIEYGRTIARSELLSLGRIVVNCTGMGAARLVGDHSMVGVRGDLIAVDNPGIKRFFAEHTEETRDQTYILPQGPDSVLLGGTARIGDLAPQTDPEIAATIIERCSEVEPRLRGARVRAHRVGVRPNRPEVRVEIERRDGVTLIHNYGHGGGGVSLSWGCAEEVCNLAYKARTGLG